MSHYQILSSQKYYADSVRQEIKEIRREKNRQAVQAFVQFLFALVVFMFTVTAIQQLPVWLPIANTFMEQYGITETLQSWAGTIQTWASQLK